LPIRNSCDSPSDQAEAPVQRWLRWAGITDITTIRFQPNLVTADAAAEREIVHARAPDAGKAF